MANSMNIQIDIMTGKVLSVTDENGVPADTHTGPLQAAPRGDILDLVSINTMRTSASPDCRWVFVDGNWVWLCT